MTRLTATLRMAMPGLVTLVLLAGCASSGNELAPAPRNRGDLAGNGSRILVCKSTDTLIDDSSQCLQDDAACYQLSNGKWCTGERGNVCPAGSVALPAGVACPPGRRCFRISESLECTIN